MKTKPTNIAGFCLMVVLACVAAGCASTPKKPSVADFVEQGLAATDSAKRGALEPGSAREKEIIERFKIYSNSVEKENLLKNTKLIYAEDVYFCDPFKTIHGEAEFEKYLLRLSDAVSEYSVEVKDVAEHDGDYYFNWFMVLKIKRDGKNAPESRTPVITHVRFGKDGKVIFHQDYFDAAGFLYEKVPVLGAGIRYIKKRL